MPSPKNSYFELSNPGRLIGLLLAIAMMLFSGYVYFRTGDWVAVVFLLGSVGYVALFLSTAGRRDK